MIKHKKLSKIKNPIIVHYTRSPFDDWSSDEIWGLYIWNNDKYYSFDVNIIYDEFWCIHDFASKLKSLIAEGGTIIHWNQTSDNFGPSHLSNRFFELTGKKLGLDYGENINLAYELIKGYGDEYINHPRLDSLAKINGFKGAESDEPSPMFNHLRTALIVKIYFASLNGTLKTLNSEYREKLLKKELLKQIKDELRSTDAEEKVLTRRDVLKELDICSNTLSNWIRESKIPYTRIGRRLYFLKSELLNLKQ